MPNNLSRFEIALVKLCRFLLVLNRNAKTTEFDLLVGAGNSGSFMCQIAKLYFEKMRGNANLPTVIIPYTKYKWNSQENEFYSDEIYKLPDDERRTFNRKGIPFVKNQIKNPRPKSILFLDDEVSGANTLRGAIEVFLDALDRDRDSLRVVKFIAEGQDIKGGVNAGEYAEFHRKNIRFFEGLKIDFDSYGKRYKDDSAIAYILNDNEHHGNNVASNTGNKKLKIALCKKLGCPIIDYKEKEGEEGRELIMTPTEEKDDSFISWLVEIMEKLCLDGEPL